MDYVNNSNKLEDVADWKSSTGFDDGESMTTEFTYDDNSNMTSDLNAEITNVTYYVLNRSEKTTLGKARGLSTISAIKLTMPYSQQMIAIPIIIDNEQREILAIFGLDNFESPNFNFN